MSLYQFVTRFVVTSTPAQVFEALLEPEAWLSDLHHVRQLTRIDGGDEAGVGRVYSTLVGAVPYRLRWRMEAVEVEPDVLFAWEATGDLAGRGSWTLSTVDGGTLVTSRWQVRTTRWWMRALSPVARPMFVANHDRVMAAGARRLADHLDAELVSFTVEQERRSRGLPSRATGR